jgi:phosphorylase/glycogen(starch) synthase
MEKRNDYLFELSWEVCNKVGGIHTVITSKLEQVQKNFEHYYCVGPYFENSLNVFKKIDTPNQFKQSVVELENIGIKLHFGTWNIHTNPDVILVEYLGYTENINTIKERIWNNYKVDSLNSKWYDFDEAILWSWSCGVAIDYLRKNYDNHTIVHAHEWMSGGSLAYFENKEIEKVSKVFTTHATMLGRTITGNQENLYSLPKDYDFEKRAYELGVHTKHQFESALAHHADTFTTVSDITAKEASIVYGKEVDVILYNGFDYNKSEEELELQFKSSRDSINIFLDTLTKDSYALNSNNTYLGYISGRYEIHNKGVDVLISALSKVNKQLKEEKSDKTFVVWFMLMFGDSTYNQRYSNILNNTTQANHKDMLQTPYELGIDNDVLKLFNEAGLENKEADNIKVLLTPTNFTIDNDLINLDYYELITGFDIGILPSYYEPWGYTPAESIACSTPCYTTDLSGIGRFDELKSCSTAMRVIPRENICDKEFIDSLASHLYQTINSSQKEQLQLRLEAQKCAKLVSWNRFYIKYLDAYDFAKSKS